MCPIGRQEARGWLLLLRDGCLCCWSALTIWFALLLLLLLLLLLQS
jgi:hypothetical protein